MATEFRTESVAARAVTLRPEPWRWNRPRVLVEHGDESAGLAIASALRHAGYAVAVCAGPHEQGQCPLTGTEGCAVAQEADVVVSCLDFERPEGQEVLDALRARCPDVPLVLPSPAAAPGEIVAAVKDAVGRRGGDGA